MKLKLLLVASVLALVGIMSTAHAEPRGARFMHGIPNPSALADKIEAHLRIDPEGVELIDPVKCRTAGDRSCGTPLAFLRSIKAEDPRATVDGMPVTTVAQIPAFLRTLRMEKAPVGTFWMFCTVERNQHWVQLPHCVARPFKKGEMVYVDPLTGKGLMAEDCDNIVQNLSVPLPCAYIYYPSDNNDDNVRYEQTGTVDIGNDACTALLRAGETDWESAFVELCPYESVICRFTMYNRRFNLEQRETGSHPFMEGMNILRVPLVCAEDSDQCRIVFCKELKDGTRSVAIGVRDFDYVLVKGKRVATLYHDISNLEAAGAMRTTNEPSNLYWHFPGDPDEDAQQQ